jgi:hypothetical protein
MAQNNSQNIVEDLTPSTDIVDIVTQLDGIEKFILDRAKLPDGASTAIALWCVATYDIDLFSIFPKLTVISPEKRCGKSTVLQLVEAFCARSLITSNISSAAIYRVIDKHQPTLIIDEADTYIKTGNMDVVGIINGSHSKKTAHIIRCDGRDHDTKKFTTWTPMVLASIGNLQPTIMDRSIVIPLRRKTNSETVLRMESDLHDIAQSVRGDLLKWVIDNQQAIKNNVIEQLPWELFSVFTEISKLPTTASLCNRESTQ